MKITFKPSPGDFSSNTPIYWDFKRPNSTEKTFINNTETFVITPPLISISSIPKAFIYQMPVIKFRAANSGEDTGGVGGGGTPDPGGGGGGGGPCPSFTGTYVDGWFTANVPGLLATYIGPEYDGTTTFDVLASTPGSVVMLVSEGVMQAAELITSTALTSVTFSVKPDFQITWAIPVCTGSVPVQDNWDAINKWYTNPLADLEFLYSDLCLYNGVAGSKVFIKIRCLASDTYNNSFVYVRGYNNGSAKQSLEVYDHGQDFQAMFFENIEPPFVVGVEPGYYDPAQPETNLYCPIMLPASHVWQSIHILPGVTVPNNEAALSSSMSFRYWMMTTDSIMYLNEEYNTFSQYLHYMPGEEISVSVWTAFDIAVPITITVTIESETEVTLQSQTTMTIPANSVVSLFKITNSATFGVAPVIEVLL